MAHSFPYCEVSFNYDYTAATQNSNHLRIYLQEGELNAVASRILQMTKIDVIAKRWELYHQIDGEIFFPLKVWPKEMKKMFFAKPIRDRHVFQLCLFLIGNGCPYNIVAEWIFTSIAWKTEKMNKSILQVRNVLHDVWRRRNKWFYFDIIHKRYYYLNGEERKRFES